ncbi:MAG: anaerobic ribonucleoside-triphosphate reductase [Candidatus Heimdallarchaeaceae archaeon]
MGGQSLQVVESDSDKRFPSAIQKRGGRLEDFDVEIIADSISSAASDLGGKDKNLAMQVAQDIGYALGEQGRIVTPDQIDQTIISILRKKDHMGTSWAHDIRSRKKLRAREHAGVLGSSNGNGNTTDSFLMVGSTSKERASQWDRQRIVTSLINEADLSLKEAKQVAEEAETYIFGSDHPHITTDLIRHAVHRELITRDFIDAANMYRSFGIPRADLENLIFTKIKENANVESNNPEAINFGLAGGILKAYALGRVFSPEVSEAHSSGMIHLHDLDMPTRLYCSAHSLEYLKKYGLGLQNLSSTSGSAKHSETLIGHLNTFLASMQAYYAGALGVGDVNVFFAPHLQKDLEREGMKRIAGMKTSLDRNKQRLDNLKEKGEVVTSLERALLEEEDSIVQAERDSMSALTQEEITKYYEQRAQSLIFNGSQNAFSRGGQTLFLDFNVHAGVPIHERNVPAILDGAYQLGGEDGKLVALEERKLDERTKSGYQLMELVDPRDGEVVLREKLVQRGKKQELIQERLNPDKHVVVYGDYQKTAMNFAHALLNKFAEGDSKGSPFAFPKCDFHVTDEMFGPDRNEEAYGALVHSCEVAEENGGVYFVFDRDSVTMSACCRLRTTIEDDYILKHPEAMRFCGFQNVTINIPQAAYRATKKGKKNLEGLFEEIDTAMDIAMDAHLQKKDYITVLQQPGGPQWQTGAPSLDGKPYVDLDQATYIIGLLGLNDALKFVSGKELHEMNADEMEEFGLRTIAHMNARALEYSDKHNLKVTLEESPAESASRRLSLVDLTLFPEESKEVVRGNIETGDTFYTNSIHYSANAPINIVQRIQGQGKFHAAIDSGAITHAFVEDEKPSATSILNLVEKTFKNTQTAQLTISPEFTVCQSCSTTSRGLSENCPECGSEEIYNMSRIVGYYSTIQNWNHSKVAELADRHDGHYGLNGGSSEGIQLELPGVERLQRPSNGGLVFHRFGKSECDICEVIRGDIEKTARKYAKKEGIELEHIYHNVETEEGMKNLLLSGLNPGRIPSVVVMGRDGEVYRGVTAQKYGDDGLELSRPSGKDFRDVIKGYAGNESS